MNKSASQPHLSTKAHFLWAVITFFVACTNAFAQTNDSIPFLYRGHLFFEGVVNDTLDCNILFDTGAANLFGVDSVYMDHSTWNPTNRGFAYAPGGAGMTKVQIILEPTTVKIGSLSGHYQMVPIFELRDILGCHIDGILGIKDLLDYPLEINFEQQYIKQYKTGFPSTDGYFKMPIRHKNNRVIDAPKGFLYLKRIKGDYSPKPTYDYSFRNRTDIGKGWIVSSLERDGDAVNAGMALGDIITAVNGKSVTDYSWDEEEALDDVPNQTIEITRTDGSKIQIVLEAKKRW